MLQRRLLGSRRRIGGISVLLTPDSRAVPVDVNPETVASWAERARKALEPPPPPPPKPRPEPRTIDIDELRTTGSLRSTAEMLAGIPRERRAIGMDRVLTGRLKIGGHRGARDLAPENTLAGIAAVHDVGVDYVEMNVRRSADGCGC